MKVDKSEFKTFLEDSSKVASYNPVLKALWYDGNGFWKKAHDEVDSLAGADAARIHAYLHRKEGDEWNADYWYKRAGAQKPQNSLDEEWSDLLRHYLSK